MNPGSLVVVPQERLWQKPAPLKGAFRFRGTWRTWTMCVRSSPACSQSKGLPDKNIRDFGGTPRLARAIE